MSEEMRQELNGVKTEVAGLAVRLDGVDVRLDNVEKVTRKIAVFVARHDESLIRIEKQLAKQLIKLDALDGIAQSLDAFTAETLALRNERTLRGQTFIEQQETLTDHELRLTRLELRRKPS